MIANTEMKWERKCHENLYPSWEPQPWRIRRAISTFGRWSIFARCSSDLKNAGNEVILVSSGAIGMGVGKLGLGSRPGDMPTKQAAAAVGQCELMYVYDKLVVRV